MTNLRNAQHPNEQIEVEPAPDASPDQLGRMVALGQRQVELRHEIITLEAQLDAKKLALKTNMEADLPQAMSEAGIETFTLEGGITVGLKKVTKASIPKFDPEPGLAWMEEHAPDLIKRFIHLEFKPGQQELFLEFIRDLNERQDKPEIRCERTVHPQTLGKFVRERDRAGQGLPDKALGVYRVTAAVVQLPEAKDEIPE